MSKKLYGLLLPVLAIAAFASMSAAAQAAPRWFECSKQAGGAFHDPDCEVETGGEWELNELGAAKVAVVTKGKLTLANANIGAIECTVKDKGFIWNPAGVGNPGLDEVTEFTNENCVAAACKKGLEVIAEGLPWPTELIAGPPIRLKIGSAAKPIEVRVKCAEPALNVLFTGELKPKFINNSPSYVEFDNMSGSLTSSLGAGTVTGTDSLVTASGNNVRAE